MKREDLSRIWRLVSDASPKGVWLELCMLEAWAQRASEHHGGVPVEHLERSLPWAAHRLNWQAKAQRPSGPAAPWPEAHDATAAATSAMASLNEAPPSHQAPHPPSRRGAGTPLGQADGWPLPKAGPQGQQREAALPPAPRRPSLAERQREAMRRGQHEEAAAMAKQQAERPALWADEGGELLPEWAQVLGVHEHPVQAARQQAAQREPALWTHSLPGEQPHGHHHPLPGEQPHGRRQAGDRQRAPSQPTPYPVGHADGAEWPTNGPSVAELLSRGPEAWPEPESEELPWPWGGDRPAAHEGPRFEQRPWPKPWGLQGKGFGRWLENLPPEYAAAGVMAGLAAAVLVVWPV